MPVENDSNKPSDPVDAAFAEFREAWLSEERPDPKTFCESRPDCGPALRDRIENFLMVSAELLDKVESRNLAQDRVVGDFRILREIGRGGMGVVYEAEQLSLGRKVALKVLPAHLGYVEESVLKFRREARAGGRQRHPGIVAIFGVGEHEGVHYIAQELVEEGFTLEDKLEAVRKEGKLPPGYLAETATCIGEAADALHHAHEAGVIHRDVKPSNILLTNDGHPKITDFGLAKLDDAMALSRTGDFAGTPFYMSPEQVTGKGRGVDRRTDIYSLGVTLYELLTLKQPFDGESSYEVLRKIPVMDPLDPFRVNPRVPRDLSTICLKAMEKSPDRRYQTMMEFADDLRRYLSGEVVLARPAGAATKIMKRIKRNPVVSSAVGAAALALIALMVWGAVYFIQMKSSYEEISRHRDLDLVYRLEAEAEDLWPAYPWRVDDLRQWMDEAIGLLTRSELYRIEWNRLQSTDQINSQESDLRDFLEKLIGEVSSLGNEEEGLIMDVANRLLFAETVRERSIDINLDAWNEAIASIADREECPQYNGQIIEPILGFVPIGRDPDSGLWEFAHLQTGEIAVRTTDSQLVLTEETGLVFILIPDGSYRMGAMKPDDVAYRNGDPNVDPLARSFEGPIHDVTISRLFLLSKYEMTQGQWYRITGKNPSKYKPRMSIDDMAINFSHPVEHVSWEDCSKVLSHLYLRLPTESEWEYAARAGTSTVWWTGDYEKTLDGCANINDRTCLEARSKLGMNVRSLRSSDAYWLIDGYPAHAPVGSFGPNGFGLHDICGNVFEWCQDSYLDSYLKTPTDGSAHESADSSYRVYRGGAWDSPVVGCRSAFRFWFDQANRYHDQGLRPAFSLP